jgi:hypothetical protein
MMISLGSGSGWADYSAASCLVCHGGKNIQRKAGHENVARQPLSVAALSRLAELLATPG